VLSPLTLPSPQWGEENKIPPLKKGDEGGFEISPNPSLRKRGMFSHMESVAEKNVRERRRNEK